MASLVNQLLDDDDLDAIRRIYDERGYVFSLLVAAADLDPRTDFVHGNLSGVSFHDADLRGYNFTGADLSSTVWTGAIYDSSTIIAGAHIDHAVDLDLRRIQHLVAAAQPTSTSPEIFIVDDDLLTRDALSVVFTLADYKVRTFADGASFLAAAQKVSPACIILDIYMPGLSGLDILRALNAEHYPTPIFMISGQGDIPTAVEAIRHGALDFIEKPFDGGTVVDRVREAIESRARRSEAGGLDALAAQFPGRDLLTPREREVLAKIAEGASNKEAGRLLGISPRTIEVHRVRIMEKLGAKNSADLARIVRIKGRGR